jgi:hypothetical protein
MTRGNQRDTDRAKAQKKAAASVSYTQSPYTNTANATVADRFRSSI